MQDTSAVVAVLVARLDRGIAVSADRQSRHRTFWAEPVGRFDRGMAIRALDQKLLACKQVQDEADGVGNE
jgi:hypothetical protein